MSHSSQFYPKISLKTYIRGLQVVSLSPFMLCYTMLCCDVAPAPLAVLFLFSVFRQYFDAMKSQVFLVPSGLPVGVADARYSCPVFGLLAAGRAVWVWRCLFLRLFFLCCRPRRLLSLTCCFLFTDWYVRGTSRGTSGYLLMFPLQPCLCAAVRSLGLLPLRATGRR